MENTSKALLIAAAVLIVILLVAFSVKILSSPQDTTESGQSVGHSIASTAQDAATKFESSVSIDSITPGSSSSSSGSTYIDSIEGNIPPSSVDDPIEENVDTSSNLIHNGIIPEGGIYYVGVPTTSEDFNWEDYSKATAIYTAGNAFPTIAEEDIYIYGDYTYFYWESKWWVWATDQTKEEYGEILYTVNNIDITNLDSTFSGCKYLVKAPIIPNGVTSMDSTFLDCASLKTPPIIPNGVTDMSSTFSGCTSLKTPPIIPNGVTTMSGIFSDCTSLETAPVIPSSIAGDHGGSLYQAFYRCISLTGEIEINCDITLTQAYHWYCFWRN